MLDRRTAVGRRLPAELDAPIGRGADRTVRGVGSHVRPDRGRRPRRRAIAELVVRLDGHRVGRVIGQAVDGAPAGGALLLPGAGGGRGGGDLVSGDRQAVVGGLAPGQRRLLVAHLAGHRGAGRVRLGQHDQPHLPVDLPVGVAGRVLDRVGDHREAVEALGGRDDHLVALHRDGCPPLGDHRGSHQCQGVRLHEGSVVGEHADRGRSSPDRLVDGVGAGDRQRTTGGTGHQLDRHGGAAAAGVDDAAGDGPLGAGCGLDAGLDQDRVLGVVESELQGGVAAAGRAPALEVEVLQLQVGEVGRQTDRHLHLAGGDRDGRHRALGRQVGLGGALLAVAAGARCPLHRHRDRQPRLPRTLCNRHIFGHVDHHGGRPLAGQRRGEVDLGAVVVRLAGGGDDVLVTPDHELAARGADGELVEVEGGGLSGRDDLWFQCCAQGGQLILTSGHGDHRLGPQLVGVGGPIAELAGGLLHGHAQAPVRLHLDALGRLVGGDADRQVARASVQVEVVAGDRHLDPFLAGDLGGRDDVVAGHRRVQRGGGADREREPAAGVEPELVAHQVGAGVQTGLAGDGEGEVGAVGDRRGEGQLEGVGIAEGDRVAVDVVVVGQHRPLDRPPGPHRQGVQVRRRCSRLGASFRDADPHLPDADRALGVHHLVLEGVGEPGAGEGLVGEVAVAELGDASQPGSAAQPDQPHRVTVRVDPIERDPNPGGGAGEHARLDHRRGGGVVLAVGGVDLHVEHAAGPLAVGVGHHVGDREGDAVGAGGGGDADPVAIDPGAVASGALQPDEVQVEPQRRVVVAQHVDAAGGAGPDAQFVRDGDRLRPSAGGHGGDDHDRAGHGVLAVADPVAQLDGLGDAPDRLHGHVLALLQLQPDGCIGVDGLHGLDDEHIPVGVGVVGQRVHQHRVGGGHQPDVARRDRCGVGL